MSRPPTAIKIKRMIRGVKIKELAAQIGYSIHTISVTETGRQLASRKLQDAFANFFGCQCSDLFDERGGAIEYTA